MRHNDGRIEYEMTAGSLRGTSLPGSPVTPEIRATRRLFLRRAGLAAAGMGLMALVQACGSNRVANRATTHEVQMNDELTFVPDKLTIRAGDTVTWRTTGAAAHTATADTTKAADPAHVKLPAGAQAWDSGAISDGQSWSYTFDTPGEYAYFCIPHEAAGMIGYLTVGE